MRKAIGLIIGFVLLVVGLLVAGPGPDLVYQWTTPEGGAPVAYYFGELEVNGEVSELEYIEGNRISLPWPDSGTLRLRVAGVDSLGRRGKFSPWSILFVDPGAPTEPGTPLRM